MCLLSRLFTSLRHIFHRGAPLIGTNPASYPIEVPTQSKSLPPETDLLHPVDHFALCEYLVGLMCSLRSLLPGSCEWLEQGALEFVGEHPVDAGGAADVWAGKMGDRKVAIKSFRCYSSTDYVVTYVRFCKEVLACSRLKDGNITPFIGVFSTPMYPLALVFDFMEHLNLREYLRNHKDVGRCELLLDIARGVDHMHKLNIVHRNLKITNVLVDAYGRARVAGLGTALLPSVILGADTFFHGAAPELVNPQRFGFTDTEATKASDMYAFGVLAWEVFSGRAPFSDEGGVAGIYSMLSGRRPPRPNHPQLSDDVWGMIEGCWESVPVRRRTIAEVVITLDAEISPR